MINLLLFEALLAIMTRYLLFLYALYGVRVFLINLFIPSKSVSYTNTPSFASHQLAHHLRFVRLLCAKLVACSWPVLALVRAVWSRARPKPAFGWTEHWPVARLPGALSIAPLLGWCMSSRRALLLLPRAWLLPLLQVLLLLIVNCRSNTVRGKKIIFKEL